MKREEAIRHIEALYPVDSQYTGTAKIGRNLLREAEENVAGWRSLPDEVLIEYARLCRAWEERHD